MPSYDDTKTRLFKRLFIEPQRQINFSAELLRIPVSQLSAELTIPVQNLFSDVFPVIHGVGLSMPSPDREELVFFTTMPAEMVDVEKLLLNIEVSPRETRYRVLR